MRVRLDESQLADLCDEITLAREAMELTPASAAETLRERLSALVAEASLVVEAAQEDGFVPPDDYREDDDDDE